MIKIIQIIILSVLVSGCATTDTILSENKLKTNMSKSQFEDVFIASYVYDDPLIPARNAISKKLNVELGEPISGKEINTD